MQATGSTGQTFPNKQPANTTQDEHDGENDGCFKYEDKKVSVAGGNVKNKTKKKKQDRESVEKKTKNTTPVSR